MNPLKVKDLLNKKAIEEKENLDLLLKINSFHWSKVRELLSTSDESMIDIRHFGTFFRKKDKTLNLLEKYKKFLNHKNTKEIYKENLIKDIELLEKALKKVEESYLLKRQKK